MVHGLDLAHGTPVRSQDPGPGLVRGEAYHRVQGHVHLDIAIGGKRPVQT